MSWGSLGKAGGRPGRQEHGRWRAGRPRSARKGVSGRDPDAGLAGEPGPPRPPPEGSRATSSAAGIVGAEGGRWRWLRRPFPVLSPQTGVLTRATQRPRGGPQSPAPSGAFPAPGAAGRTAAAPWRPPRARGPQSLPRGGRPPPRRCAQPGRPLRSRGKDAAWAPGRASAAGPPWPTPPLGPSGRGPGESRAAVAAPGPLAARPQRERRRLEGGAPRAAGWGGSEGPQPRGVEVEGSVLGKG